MPRTLFLSFNLVIFLAHNAEAQTSLPVVEDVEWMSFRTHCRQVIQALEKASSPLPAKTLRALTPLLDRRTDGPEGASAAVQKLLDGHCLVGVSINPESRVKAARGPASVVLRQDHPTLVLIKVHNDGGVTHALRLHGPELIGPGERGSDCWLRARLATSAPFAPELTGRRVEYRVLSLTPRQFGKREATFQFDVGQGTQDLGFRAEVPILFTIRKAD